MLPSVLESVMMLEGRGVRVEVALGRFDAGSKCCCACIYGRGAGQHSAYHVH